MRGSHNGPLMPCHMEMSQPARFDGPPRVVGMGFQLADGQLVGPRDLLGNASFDRAREQALEMADYIRRMGPFEPDGSRPRRWSTRPCHKSPNASPTAGSPLRSRLPPPRKPTITPSARRRCTQLFERIGCAGGTSGTFEGTRNALSPACRSLLFQSPLEADMG